MPNVIWQCRIDHHENLTTIGMNAADSSDLKSGHTFGVARRTALLPGKHTGYAIFNKLLGDVRLSVDGKPARLEIAQRYGCNLKDAVFDVVRVEQRPQKLLIIQDYAG